MEVAPFKMEVAPFFVEFHNLRTFVAIYIMSRFTHFFRNFFWPNSLLRNITRFLHVCLKAWRSFLVLEAVNRNQLMETLFLYRLYRTPVIQGP